MPTIPGGRGLVIAEGVVVVERLLASAYPVRALLGVRRRIDELADALAPFDVPAYTTTAEIMAEVVGFHLNRGVLAVADRAPTIEPADLIANSRRLAVLEGIGDHENLGSIFRNAAALGIDGILLGAGCAEDLKLLKDHDFRILALTPRADSVPLRETNPQQGRVAVLLGSEGPGLTEQAITAADQAVRIPMASGVDSLNVATAGAIAFHTMNGG